MLDFAKDRKQITSAEISSNDIVKADPEFDSEDAGNSASTQIVKSKKSSAAHHNHQLVKASTMELDDDGSDGRQSTMVNDDRDEHGQSILHFASARSHGKNALLQLIQESDSSIAYRDELYRTARDVSLQANQPENAKEIDRYVLGLAARGDVDSLQALVMDGYDHVVDVTDADGTTIEQIARSRGHTAVVDLMMETRDFEQMRENFLAAVRSGNLPQMKEILTQIDGNKVCRAKNYYGR